MARGRGLGDRLMGLAGGWLMGRVVPRKLLSQLERHLHIVAPGRESELRDAIERRFAEIVAADRELVVDGPSEGMLAMSAVVLASFEVLRGEVGDDDRTILLLQHVFEEVLQRSMEAATRILVRPDDPVAAADRAIRSSSAMYGEAMDFEFERDGAQSFEMRVTGCFFQRFFARHGATRATTVLCSWDANWMRAIDPAVTGVIAERTSLLSLGDDACRFRVARTDDPLARPRDVLRERFAASRPGAEPSRRG